MIMAIVSAIAILIVPFLYAAWVKADTARMRKRSEYANRFFAAAKPLVSDSETPVELLDILEYLNHQIGNSHAATEFVMFINKSKAAEPLSAMARNRLEVIHHFLDRRPELKESYSNALNYGMLSMSFMGSRMFGYLLRVWLTGDVGSSDISAKPRSESIISKLKGNGVNSAMALAA